MELGEAVMAVLWVLLAFSGGAVVGFLASLRVLMTRLAPIFELAKRFTGGSAGGKLPSNPWALAGTIVQAAPGLVERVIERLLGGLGGA